MLQVLQQKRKGQLHPGVVSADWLDVSSSVLTLGSAILVH